MWVVKKRRKARANQLLELGLSRSQNQQDLSRSSLQWRKPWKDGQGKSFRRRKVVSYVKCSNWARYPFNFKKQLAFHSCQPFKFIRNSRHRKIQELGGGERLLGGIQTFFLLDSNLFLTFVSLLQKVDSLCYFYVLLESTRFFFPRWSMQEHFLGSPFS